MDKLVERFGTCSKDCYGGCAFKGFWDDSASNPLQRAVALKNHPFTQGVFCGKLNNRIHYIYHKNRIKHPLYSENKLESEFQRISLSYSYQLISEKIKQVRTENGSHSILGVFYSGNTGLISQLSPLRFFHAINATVTTGGVCNEGGCAGLNSLFGTYSITNPLQLSNKNTKLIVIWGSNLTENNNHAHLLVRNAKKNGAKLVVLDSRKTKIANEANLFIPILPGMDYLIARYILYNIVKDNLVDRDFLKNHVNNGDWLLERIPNFDDNLISLVKIASLSSIEKIHTFLRFLKDYRHNTIFNVGYGVQKDVLGGKIVQTIAGIQILLGNLGKQGTGIIYSQSDFNKRWTIPLIQEICQLNDWRTELSTVHIRELGHVLDSGKIKLLFVYNCNPANSLPNQNLLRRNLSRKDLFVVVLDQFLNETTKYANLIIPAKFDVETYDVITPYYFPSISVNIAGPCPYPECVSNHEFFQTLGEYLSIDAIRITNYDLFEKCIKLLPDGIQDALKNKGYYSLFDHTDISYQKEHFPTRNGKINVDNINFDFQSPNLHLLTKIPSTTFFLLTPNKGEYLHSQLGENNGKDRGIFNRILMNSNDCVLLKLKEQDLVEIENDNGKGEFTVAISDAILPNTVVIFHGLYTISGLNANFFTSDIPESLGNSGSFNSSLVTIRKKI